LVNILSLFTGKKKSFFSKEDEERMVQAIRFAEKQTSGEVRLFVESHCSYIQPIDRAKELFAELKMTANQRPERRLTLFRHEGPTNGHLGR